MISFNVKKYTSYIVVLLMLTFLALTKPVVAADPNLVLDRIRDTGEFRVPVMVGEEPGFVKDRSTGKWGGFYIEWAEEIAGHLGAEVVPVETTWGNLAGDFQAGKIDIAIGLNPNPKRGLVVDYLNVTLFTDAWAIVAQGDFNISSWKGLNDPSVRLVVQKGSTMQVVAEALTPKAQIIPVEDRPLGVAELMAKRADAMIVAIFDAVKVVQALEGSKVVLPTPMLRNPATIGIRREDGNQGYMNWLTNWVYQQRALGLAQGKLNKAFEEHGIDLSVLPPEFSF